MVPRRHCSNTGAGNWCVFYPKGSFINELEMGLIRHWRNSRGFKIAKVSDGEQVGTTLGKGCLDCSQPFV